MYVPYFCSIVRLYFFYVFLFHLNSRLGITNYKDHSCFQVDIYYNYSISEHRHLKGLFGEKLPTSKKITYF